MAEKNSNDRFITFYVLIFTCGRDNLLKFVLYVYNNQSSEKFNKIIKGQFLAFYIDNFILWARQHQKFFTYPAQIYSACCLYNHIGSSRTSSTMVAE